MIDYFIEHSGKSLGTDYAAITTLIYWGAAMYLPAPSGLYYLLGWGASSGLASSAPNVCVFVPGFSSQMYQVLFSSSLSLALNCPSRPVFFIKIAALRAHLGDVSIDFVVILRYAYPFSSSFHVLLLSARNFRHVDRMWCTVCSPCPHKSHPLSSTPGTLHL